MSSCHRLSRDAGRSAAPAREVAGIAQAWQRWAAVEACGSSPTYERLALAVAADPGWLALLDPPLQPNLVFGVLRWHEVDVTRPEVALAWLADHEDLVRAELATRRTQTNEVARCALLLPALSLVQQATRRPISLIEVGASAGLCLLYDAWGYHYVGDGVDHHIAGGPPVLTCSVDGPVPLPAAVPTIAWRAGLDLAPIDATDADARRWLECLVWPEHSDRAERLRDALAVAAVRRPRIVAGDAVAGVSALIAQAPRDTTVVVTHSATLAYLSVEQRQAFVRVVADAGAHRVGAEAPTVLPHLGLPRDTSSQFVISVDDQALGTAQMHGRSLTWFGD